jgi:hypothetical protein
VVAPGDALAVREAARALRLEVEQALLQRVLVAVRLPLGSTQNRGSSKQQQERQRDPEAVTRRRGRGGATHCTRGVPARRLGMCAPRLLPPRRCALSHVRRWMAGARPLRAPASACLPACCGLSAVFLPAALRARVCVCVIGGLTGLASRSVSRPSSVTSGARARLISWLPRTRPTQAHSVLNWFSPPGEDGIEYSAAEGFWGRAGARGGDEARKNISGRFERRVPAVPWRQRGFGGRGPGLFGFGW